MAKAELVRFDKTSAGTFIIALLTPRIRKYVTIRRTMTINPLTWANKLWAVESYIKDYFDQPHNAPARKALAASMYAGNLSLLAKKLAQNV